MTATRTVYKNAKCLEMLEIAAFSGKNRKTAFEIMRPFFY